MFFGNWPLGKNLFFTFCEESLVRILRSNVAFRFFFCLPESSQWNLMLLIDSMLSMPPRFISFLLFSFVCIYFTRLVILFAVGAPKLLRSRIWIKSSLTPTVAPVRWMRLCQVSPCCRLWCCPCATSPSLNGVNGAAPDIFSTWLVVWFFIVLFIFGSLDWKGSCTRMLSLFQSEGKDIGRDILFGLLNVLRADITRQEFHLIEQ